jgi:hypothetical protein
MVRRSAILLVVLAVASLGVASAFASSKSTFKPGVYLGKTSQGEPVKLKVVGCGKGQCLEAPDNFDIIVNMPCPSINETSSEAVSPAYNSISKGGHVNGDQDSFSKVVASFQVGHNGSLTGKIRSTETLEEGARCDSGTVTLRAKIGGSTK